MSVIMYDCGFGDCFCLQEEYVNRPLFIDFGIHSASKKGDKIEMESQIRLNDFGNEVSIVFHNNCDKQDRRNILFTGDVHSNAWDTMEILQEFDGIRLHDEYGIIKAPHHGTRDYFHDFGAYASKTQETKIMIPNGDIKRTGHNISSCYPNSCRGMLMYCSNNNSCEENALHRCCTCAPRVIVSANPPYCIL